MSPESAVGPRLHAVVLAGGTARRLGGVSKPDLRIGSDTLLGLTLAALPADTGTVVVVAPPGVAVPPTALRTLEDPPLGGPACGIAAGWRTLRDSGIDEGDAVALMACDAPRAGLALPSLLGALDSPEAPRLAVALGVAGGRVQFLPCVLRADTLDALVEDLGHQRDVPLRRLLAGAHPLEVAVDPALLADIDSWEDAERFRAEVSPGA